MNSFKRLSAVVSVGVLGMALSVSAGPALANGFGAAPTGGDSADEKIADRASSVLRCRGQRATIVGRGDKVEGTEKRDVIVLLRASKVVAKGGNDLICGSRGRDRINSGPGRDVVLAEGGNDVVNGQNGDDTLLGGDGDDELHGGLGDDELHGGLGDDDLDGHDGDDELYGDDGDDDIHDDDGDDDVHDDDEDDADD